MRLPTVLLAAATFATLTAAEGLSVSFLPQDLPKKVATCKALNRASQEVKDIGIDYVEVNPNAERTVLMVHGWPSLWHSWKYQIEEFKDDFRLIVPDLRGFGPSGHPGDVKSSGTIPDIVGDLTCVLAHAGVSNVVCMGHDWGTSVCFQLARQRPDLALAVLGSIIPYLPNAGPYAPTSALVPVFPELAYQVFLGETPKAAADELDRDVRRSLRATLRTVASPPPEGFLTDTHSFLSAYADIAEIPPIPFFTKEEEDYWVEQYSIQGFYHTLQFYTPDNQHGTWAFIDAQGNRTITHPVLAIYPLNDPVANWEEAAKLLHSADYLPNLTTHLIKGAHWAQLENPTAFNGIARPWLEGLPWASKSQEGVHGGRPADEL